MFEDDQIIYKFSYYYCNYYINIFLSLYTVLAYYTKVIILQKHKKF